MVLSGTLREFILADVMQLLTQQKITGKLILNSNRSEGTIVFKNGNIVAAMRETETFSVKLFHYLTGVLQQPRNKIRELFSSYEGKTAELTDYLEKKQLLNHQELENYATSVTIDIACSLFLWTNGNYHFDSYKSVDHLIPAHIELPVENIVMEAMRRIDEWHRMRELITEETVFVQTRKSIDFTDTNNPLENPTYYYYQQINGTQPFKVFLDNSFQTEYKIYECFYSLLQSEHIRSLSESLSRSVHAAISRTELDNTTIPPIISIFSTIGAIAGIFLISWLYRSILFQDLTIASTVHKNETFIIFSENNEKEAHRFIQYNSIYNDSLKSELSRYSSITKRDIHFLRLKNKLMHSTKQK
jgi:hypothetical protein